jgi:hypothetical protein
VVNTVTITSPTTEAEKHAATAPAQNGAPRRASWAIVLFCLLCGLIYRYSSEEPATYYDYPLRNAEAFLNGQLGFTGEPPGHLNEMIYLPAHGCYTNGFPLGQAITALPFAWLKKHGWIERWRVEWLVAASMAAAAWWAIGLARHSGMGTLRSCWLAAALLFGTWAWTNIVAYDAWQIALGLGFAWNLGALHALIVRRDALVCGFWFAMAFGQRTEIVTLAPLMAWLWWHLSTADERKRWLDTGIRFCLAPLLIGCLTLAYNYLRFGKPTDFGHSHVPHTIGTELYKYGIFAFEPEYWWRNFYVMFLKPWNRYDGLLGLVPDRFGCSILLASPLLLLLLRPRKTGTRTIEAIAWLALAILIVPLYCHGDPGCGQYAYRYGLPFLPWIYLLLLRTCHPARSTFLENTLIALSIATSTYATYVFRWTKIGFE